jgi:predicted enzyme related to lactoylglutathione lyase
VDWKLELVPLPVADVERAKSFYMDKVGFNLDHDVRNGELRVVQLTPPGSACSIVIGKGIVNTPPGSVKLLHLVVPDIQAARAELVERGVEVTEVQDFGGGITMAFFDDPDGNSWAVQHIAPGAGRLQPEG